METGIKVIGRLFNAIIEENHLSLKISEIEGDAIFFYQFGAALTVEKILWQYRRMLKRFRQVLYSFKDLYPSVLALSLKAIIHYGRMQEFGIDRFQKLYGRVIVDAHRLLKNSVPGNTYALFTNEYLACFNEHVIPDRLGKSQKQCVLYDVGRLCYTYFPFAEPSTQI